MLAATGFRPKKSGGNLVKCNNGWWFVKAVDHFGWMSSFALVFTFPAHGTCGTKMLHDRTRLNAT
jgi:hypothetical protein